MPPGRSPLAEIFAELDAVFRRLGLRWYLFGAQAIAVLAAGGDRLDLAMIRETLAMLEEALSQSDLLPRLEEALSRARHG